jgi:hypothetical protein
MAHEMDFLRRTHSKRQEISGKTPNGQDWAPDRQEGLEVRNAVTPVRSTALLRWAISIRACRILCL